MEVNFADAMQAFERFLWPLTRIAAVFAVAPVIGSQLAPMRVRAGAAIVVTLALFPALDITQTPDPLSSDGVMILATQVLIGLVIGFALQFVFAALMVAADHMSMAMGLGMAQMSDPQSGATVPVVGQIYVALATLMFLSLNGHHALLTLLANSFELWPIMHMAPISDLVWRLLELSALIFSAALRVAVPVLTALLAANLAMGVMTRAAPQMNIFSVGLPVTVLLGMVVIWATLSQFNEIFADLLETTFLALGAALRES